MKVKLKPVAEQVIVLTGATSGIGLVTARMAGQKGAKLVLAARNGDALRKLAEELEGKGTDVVVQQTDVANGEEINRLAHTAIEQHGRIDTWINNAGVSIYGRLDDVPSADSRRLFETNFWGVVNGSLAAVKRMRDEGGAIINVGSTLSDRAIPLQGMYCASKHAVKGFTDSLRMELESEGAPISITLVKPASVDTPYAEHARNYIGVKPENPGPIYSPDAVAETILYCSENAVRDVFVGGAAKAISAISELAPRTTDVMMEKMLIYAQQAEGPPDNTTEGLYASRDSSLSERGSYDGYVAETSIYTKASLHPVATGAAIALGVGGFVYAMSKGQTENEVEPKADPHEVD